ncbi:MAG TPA: hypothetical protein VF759_11065 [Allosphingosinicella sp.]|jgi:hypothetical protein
MNNELPKDDQPAETSAATKKSWLKPTAAVVEARRAESNPGSGADGNNCHS